MLSRTLLAAAVLLLSGCGANFTSIYRDYDVASESGTTSVLIDAKQRAIISTPNKDPAAQRAAFVCAEPSPDALSAISSTFAGSAGFGQPGTNVQAALSAAVQEAASQLGTRNATIQLLRDGLYRQCEAYMNGLIDDQTYDQIANKYVNAMVVLLAVEEITPSGATGHTIKAGDGTEVSANTEVKVTVPTPAAAGPTPADAAASPPAAPDDAAAPPAPGAGGGESTGRAGAKGKAGAPVVSVNLNQHAGASEEVALAVTAMTQSFLRKDTVDFCLYTIPRIARDAAQQRVSETFIQFFADVCGPIIKAEHQSGMELSSALVQSLRETAELNKMKREALEGIPEGLPPIDGN